MGGLAHPRQVWRPVRDSLSMRRAPGRWNDNIHYHPVILGAIPYACRRALDVGCGEGTLTRELRRRVREVVGIDDDQASIAVARAHPDAGDIWYIAGDALGFGFEPGSFDAITAVASLHHMDAEPALIHLKDLLRPRGVLAVIGLARSSPSDWPLDVAAIAPHHLRRRRSGYWQHPSPTVWPPPESYRSMRQITRRVLPGAQLRRRLYWRYTLAWIKP
jgi:SAM-dependent methyltransferase